MELFLVVFGTMMLVVVAMAVGAIVSGKVIKGSCGGIEAAGIECGVCDKPCKKKEKMLAELAAQEAAQEAGKDEQEIHFQQR